MRDMASNLKVLSSTYTWNYDNMLTDVAITGGNTYHYKYDGLRNRVAKIVTSIETRYAVEPKRLGDWYLVPVCPVVKGGSTEIIDAK
jgi:YD repeat-containing protein